MRKRLPTWAGRISFEYSGSVAKGTEIWFGRKPYRETISTEQYSALLNHFRGATVDIGTSFDNPPTESVGAWLQANVTKRATASYVGAILVHEGYADRVPEDPSKIRFP